MKNLTSGELQRFFDVALDLLCIADTDGNFIKVNKAWEDILGYTREMLENRQFLEFVHPDDLDETLRAMAVLEKQKEVLNFVNRYRCSDGSYRFIEWRSSPYGKVIYAAARDITERKKTEDLLRESEARSRALVEAIPDLLFRYNSSGEYLDAQIKDKMMLYPSARQAYEHGGLVGASIHSVLPYDTADVLQKMISRAIETGKLQVAEYNYISEGETQHFEARLMATEKKEVVSIVRDISDEKRNEAELEYLSLHDPLTGLYNRSYFQDELSRLEGGRDYPVALISADLDALKLINDTLGHKDGDRLLTACAAVLQKSLRSSDVLARVGGDEFALVLPRTNQAAGEEVMNRIRGHLESYNRKQPHLPLSISIGLAVAESSSETLEETYHTADSLMYKDKLKRGHLARTVIIENLLAAFFKRVNLQEGSNERVQELCFKLGQKAGIGEEQMANLLLLAQVYELGKVTVPDKLLHKEGKLTEQEWEVIRQHSEKGYRIATASRDLENISDLILRHHENWDGSGYPLGLSGEEIPLECRILALANAYSVMVFQQRPYAKSVSSAEALHEIKLCAGTFYDPKLVAMFSSVIEEEQQA